MRKTPDPSVGPFTLTVTDSVAQLEFSAMIAGVSVNSRFFNCIRALRPQPQRMAPGLSALFRTTCRSRAGLGRSHRHVTARLLASATRCHTRQHSLVAARELLAIFRACFTQIGTKPAIINMMFAHSEHEVGARHTGLGTIGKQLLMRGRGVHAAHHETVGSGLDTGGMAIQAVSDALSHLFG
jgi:hypothetical protein